MKNYIGDERSPNLVMEVTDVLSRISGDLLGICFSLRIRNDWLGPIRVPKESKSDIQGHQERKRTFQTDRKTPPQS